MPESRCITHSVRKPKPSLPTVTWPEKPPSKYFAVASRTRALTRVAQRLANYRCSCRRRETAWSASSSPERASAGATPGNVSDIRLGTAPEHVNATRKPSLRDGIRGGASFATASRADAAPRTECASPRGIWRRCGGQCRCRRSRSFSTMVSSDSTSVGALGVDHLLDAVTHRLGRMRLAAVGRGDRRGEEIFQLEDAAAGRHVLVGGDARHRRFVHADGVGHGLEIERPQMLHAVHEERILLADDLGRQP